MDATAPSPEPTPSEETSPAPAPRREEKRQRRPRKAQASGAPSGMIALSVWFGAAALIAVVVRIGMAERGEGVAAGAQWLGVLFLTVLLAGGIWLVARSMRWFHGALSVLLFASTAALVARWAVQRAAMKEADVEVSRLLVAVEEARGDQVDKTLDEIERAARGASLTMRRSAEIIVEARRAAHRIVVTFQATSDKLTQERMLDVSGVKAASEIEPRKETLRAFIAASKALRAHDRDVHDHLDAKLKAVQEGAGAAVLADGRAAATQAERDVLRDATREAEQRWAEGNLEVLGVFQDTFGAWTMDPSGTIAWTDEAGRARYEAANERTDRAFGELHRIDATLWARDLTVSKKTVLESRSSFISVRRTLAAPKALRFQPPVPPPNVLQRIRYRASPGELHAYVTPDPRDHKRHPAVVWAHGGFEGIGAYMWTDAPPENDQSARALREAGLVVMYPSLRGENDNPGSFEMFYGELEDLNAAADHLASLPYVDPERIYLAGHSAGGTLALLAAATSDRYRAVFSFGGIVDVTQLAKQRPDTPFDPASEDEIRLRSAVNFGAAIKTQTFYFEGAAAADVPSLRRMEALAARVNAPLDVRIVYRGDHMDILDPLTRLVAQKIRDDAPPGKIKITEEEVQKAFDGRRRSERASAKP